MKKALDQMFLFQVKFSKVITLVCLGMDLIITFFAMVCHVLSIPVDSATLVTMYSPWSFELGFNMAITLWDKKHKKTEETNE